MSQTPNESQKKGRPTPKRSEATQKRRALAPIKTKEEKKRAREAAKAARIAARAAYMRGDESTSLCWRVLPTDYLRCSITHHDSDKDHNKF